MNHLAVRSEYQIATLLIATDNERSLALAQRCGFSATDEFSNSRYFKRPVPPLSYSDGTVTIRRRRADDLEADLEAKDDEQIDWLWLSGQRESWEAMTIGEQRSHALSSLLESHARFATGPKWAFTVDTTDVAGVAYVDCDLHNDHVPPGEANIAYSAHPAHRGKGWVTSAVRLVVQFLSDHTAAREAHLLVDSENEASSRVARAVGATAREQWQDEDGRTVVRHVLSLDRRPVAGQRSPSSGAADVHGANDRW
jgi:RimJ/RimL family protein N-acetyltransferase